MCLESFKTLGKNNTTRGDERPADPFWLQSWDFPTFTWWERELLGVAAINPYYLQCKHHCIFPSACKLEFWRQGLTFIVCVCLAICSFWINTVCAVNIFLGWWGFYSQGKVTCVSISLILSLWGGFVYIYSKNAQLVTELCPTCCDQSFGCDLRCDGTLGSFAQLGHDVPEVFWHLALLIPGLNYSGNKCRKQTVCYTSTESSLLRMRAVTHDRIIAV